MGWDGLMLMVSFSLRIAWPEIGAFEVFSFFFLKIFKNSLKIKIIYSLNSNIIVIDYDIIFKKINIRVIDYGFIVYILVLTLFLFLNYFNN